ncbi:hypothetical protein QZM46_14265 [Burkholderia vietnamiensis]|uniref:hypothetical protein n=1 Tax=Burkholderia vietnamiensis TaxID=60552 RepID=UPI0012D9AF5C|nr:hypothetical protein [Burkholderia vietnamiensis]MBR8001117.1 hypothetical protein [Burkholderia vietnamiensis]MBR8087346.1 hypothetical protein [Burkholderia vietnamiensis]MDN7552488.1 hypothetical protein [Burkholderia vietnamiensis]HDR9080342.1 hypothetical protein [Burkholderia vietnamiensis]HDR9093022.1 hypothetical protein [Burkholderia vietnamiensis]
MTAPPPFSALRRKTVRPRWVFERRLDAPRVGSIDSSDPSIRAALKPKTHYLSTHIVSNSKVVTGASQCSGAEPVDTLTRYCRRRERADCRYAAG